MTERPLRILLVEDEQMNRALLRATLARAKEPELRHATLIEASTLAAARGAVVNDAVDVALVDVRLPDGNGLDLARELAALPAGRPRIAILSASVLPGERSAALAVGADRFLGKPYRPSDLVDLLLELRGERSRAAEDSA